MSAHHEALRDMLAAMPPYEPATAKLWAAFNRVSRLGADAAVAVEAHRKPDRSAILRMAGNIASGLAADPMFEFNAETRERIAATAVDIARRIMRITDEPEAKP